MATRRENISAKSRTRRELQVRDHVITLVKYLDTVIHDIKYVVSDLQVLLEQIDHVSRQLDESSQPTATTEGKLGVKERSNRCFSSPTSCRLTNPLLNRAKRISSATRKTKRSSKAKAHMFEDSSSVSSWDRSMQRNREHVAEMDNMSVELNAMWDNAFDKELLAEDWVDSGTDLLGSVGNTTEFLCTQTGDGCNTNTTPWLNSKLEQSLTSGIEMLSFTDDSENDCISPTFPIFDNKQSDFPNEIYLNVDPYHVCCKDVIPVGSDGMYCGVYEAMLDACLEPRFGMVESESFTSDIGIQVQLFENEREMEDESRVNYEPMYNTQLNTWTAYTMVALDSLQTSEDELSDTALDILNDNLPPSTVIDNLNSINANNDTVSTEDQTCHQTSTLGELKSSTTCIMSCLSADEKITV